MNLRIKCLNCREEVLQCETQELWTPLKGSMFKVKKDMEWAIFSPEDTGRDLICPMCNWCFAFDDVKEKERLVYIDPETGKDHESTPAKIRRRFNEEPEEYEKVLTPEQLAEKERKEARLARSREIRQRRKNAQKAKRRQATMREQEAARAREAEQEARVTGNMNEI